VQSASAPQSPRHAAGPQVYGAQDCSWRSGQRPAPSQAAASVATPFAQLGARHSTSAPGYAQAAREAPSQAPPQADPAPAQAARAPCGAPATGAQVPTEPGASQASHCPPHAASQHTPSTQKPLWHWFAWAQLAPCASLGAQTPAAQKSPGTQSESAAQLPRQAAWPQTYGAQGWVCAAGQRPAPSQAAASVATPALQLAVRHSEAGYAQAPVEAPSQAPPQAEPSLAHAGRAPWGAPATGAQVPTEPAASQAWHWPPHAVSQQTPSTQKPVAHWFAPAQAAPAASLGVQTPAAQKSPPAQSPSAAQFPRHADAPQAYGAQACVWTAGQLPAPSQAAASVATPAAQEPARHEVSSAG
jgi:hypothetical protein